MMCTAASERQRKQPTQLPEARGLQPLTYLPASRRVRTRKPRRRRTLTTIHLGHVKIEKDDLSSIHRNSNPTEVT